VGVPSIVPIAQTDMGAALALLEAIRTRAADDMPWPRAATVEDLRYRLARDERESGPTWFVLRDPDTGALEGLAGYDAAASSRPDEIFLDGPLIWLDLRRRGRGSRLLQHVLATARQRLGAITCRAVIGEGNEAAATFLEARGFTLRTTRRTLVCRDAHARQPDLPAGVSLVTPADEDEQDACHALLRACDPRREISRTALRQRALDRRWRMRLALAGSDAVGFCEASLDLLEETAWIEEHAVAGPWQSSGLGPALLASVLNEVFAEPRIRKVQVELVTPPGFTPRREELYRGQGFAPLRADLEYILHAEEPR
jgi:GNAT superfamily N-acetyltransferase